MSGPKGALLGSVQAAMPAGEREEPMGRTRTWLLAAPTAFWLGLVVIAMLIAFDAISGGVFLGTTSIDDLGLNASSGLLLAAAVTFPLAAAQLDLSLGANLVLSSVVAADVFHAFVSRGSSFSAGSGSIVLASVLAAFAAIASGALFGFVNGVVVTRLRVNSFIATLGTGGCATGLVLVLTGGNDISGFPPSLEVNFGTASVASVLPYQTLIVLVICGALWYLMRRARIGLHAVAIGTSTVAARRSGLPVGATLTRLFVGVGALAGLAGFFSLAQYATTNIGGSQDAALEAIAAAVIGGTSLFGGVASVGGSLLGALFSVVLASGLIVVGVPSFYQQIAVGVILIFAVYIDQQRRSRRER